MCCAQGRGRVSSSRRTSRRCSLERRLPTRASCAGRRGVTCATTRCIAPCLCTDCELERDRPGRGQSRMRLPEMRLERELSIDTVSRPSHSAARAMQGAKQALLRLGGNAVRPGKLTQVQHPWPDLSAARGMDQDHGLASSTRRGGPWRSPGRPCTSYLSLPQSRPPWVRRNTCHPPSALTACRGTWRCMMSRDFSLRIVF